MSSAARRLERLEGRYGIPADDNPYRIPAWLRPWFDPLTIEDLELLEAAGFVPEIGSDPDTLTPADRARHEALLTSYRRFCEEHAP